MPSTFESEIKQRTSEGEHTPPFTTSLISFDSLPPQHPQHHIDKNFDVTRLKKLYPYLWWAGLAGNTRPLHRQHMLGRDIIITEQADLHLVWYDTRIFIKPLPSYLLNFDFYKKNICINDDIFKDANGLLRSYTHLIRYESDFRIALKEGLLPESIHWKDWIGFVWELKQNLTPNNVCKRYMYGELRLGRLNQLMYCFHHKFMKGYFRVDATYTDFFGRNFAWLVLVFAYASVVLSALQVGVGTTQGAAGWFMELGWVITCVSLLGVAIAVSLMGCVFVGIYSWNVLYAWKFDQDARRKMRLEKDV